MRVTVGVYVIQLESFLCYILDPVNKTLIHSTDVMPLGGISKLNLVPEDSGSIARSRILKGIPFFTHSFQRALTGIYSCNESTIIFIEFLLWSRHWSCARDTQEELTKALPSGRLHFSWENR